MRYSDDVAVGMMHSAEIDMRLEEPGHSADEILRLFCVFAVCSENRHFIDER